MKKTYVQIGFQKDFYTRRENVKAPSVIRRASILQKEDIFVLITY